MVTDRVADLTMDELKKLITTLIQAERQVWPGQLQGKEADEALAWTLRHIIELEPGQPSTLEMLREDRDR